MSRYIDADAAKKAMQKLEDDDFELYGCDIPEGFHADRAIKVIDNIPIADVQAVKHGKWIVIDNQSTCSCCGFQPFDYGFDYQVDYPYCPHCGAKMDGENK